MSSTFLTELAPHLALCARDFNKLLLKLPSITLTKGGKNNRLKLSCKINMFYILGAHIISLDIALLFVDLRYREHSSVPAL